MRIILFGTGPFAVPTFESLLQSDHEIPLLVTRPITDPGKRRKSAPNPTRDLGEANGLEIYDPLSINSDEAIEKLKTMVADLYMVCDYGQILSRECLGIARLGGINLHGSLLPRYRGAAPINWAVYHGEETLGVTVIHMTSKLDGGPALQFAQLTASEDETAEDLEPRLARIGVPAVNAAIEMLQLWDGQSAIGETQDPKLATKAPRLSKKDGLIDWSRTQTEIINQIRAFQPWPNTFTHWNRKKGQPIRMIIRRAVRWTDTITGSHSAGQVCHCDKNSLVIMTGDGPLSLTEIQPAGKRKMEASEFLRGYRPELGDLFA